MKMKFLLALFLTLSTVGAFASEVSIPKEVLDRHSAACSEFSSNEYLQREVYKLSDSSTLYILGCEMYAYNTMEKAYILTSWGELTDVAVAEVLADGSIVATNDLMGTGYEESTKTLITFQKGRGMGDCGSTATYVYSSESARFVLTEARFKEACDDDVEAEWPIVYKK